MYLVNDLRFLKLILYLTSFLQEKKKNLHNLIYFKDGGQNLTFSHKVQNIQLYRSKAC